VIKLIAFILLAISPIYGAPQELIVGVHPGLSYPDYARANGKHIGIIPALFDSFAKAKGYKIIYKMEPRKRMDELVQKGEIHARCLVAKSWVEKQEEFLWSRKIFKELSTFVRHKNTKDLNTFSDLKGKSFAGILGFIYGPEITGMVKKGQLERFNVIRVENLIKMVELKRADYALESERVLKRLIKNRKDFTLTKLIQGQVDHFCLFSKNVPQKNIKSMMALRDDFNEFFSDEVLQKTLAPFGLNTK
jgi:ABC-type amino acid transport substrate-binding protein